MAIYNRNDQLRVIALKDATINQGGSAEWNVPSSTDSELWIAFKHGLTVVASGNILKSDNPTLTEDGALITE
jgi:hypothetical protein